MPSSTSSSDAAPAYRRFVAAFLVTLAVGIAGVATATEWMIRVHVVPNHNFYKYLDVFKSAPASDAIFGDSQVAYGLTGLPGFVNAAYGGDDFVNLADKVQLFFAKRPMRRVILQAGLHHFSYEYVYRVGRDDSFADLLADPKPRFAYLFHPLHRREIANYWSTLLSGRGFVPRTLVRPDGSQWTFASLAADHPRPRLDAAARLASQLTPLAGFQAGPVATEMRAALRRLVEGGADVCMVTMPVAPELLAAMNAIPAFTAARDFFAALAREMSVRYLDLRDRVADRRLFGDLNHLNADGAKAFSPIVARACFGASG